MRYFGLICLLFISCFCFGQGPRFQLYLTKACSTIERLDTNYYLISSDPGDDLAYVPKSGTVYLPKAGSYIVGFREGPVLSNSVVEIKDTGLFIMRYKEPKIELYESGAYDTPPYYVKCDSSMNGYQEDFYENGTLKMRGNFKNGRPKNSIVSFYPNGAVKKRVLFFPKVVDIKEFDSAGNLIKLSLNENKSFMVYSEYRRKTFFTNGKMASEESSIKRVVRRTEFYPSGKIKLKQTEKYRTEYFENGTKELEYKWRYKKEGKTVSSEADVTIYAIWYNEGRHIIQKAIYEYWIDHGPQPKLDFSGSDWIVSFVKYQNGKKTIEVEDMDTKEFNKKYGDDFNTISE